MYCIHMHIIRCKIIIQSYCTYAMSDRISLKLYIVYDKRIILRVILIVTYPFYFVILFRLIKCNDN